MERDVLKVKTDRTQNKFVGRQSLRDDERVIDDVAAKDQAASDCVNEVHRPSKRNEHVDDPNHYCRINFRFLSARGYQKRTQSHEGAEQPRSKTREIVLQAIVGYSCTD